MYPALIRSILTKHYPKLGHCNIKGNDNADKAAKLALKIKHKRRQQILKTTARRNQKQHTFKMQ